MKKRSAPFFLSAFLFSSLSLLLAQKISLWDYAYEVKGENAVTLAHPWLIENSEEVFLNGVKLRKEEDYLFDQDTRTVIILLPLTSEDTIRVEYEAIPISLKTTYGNPLRPVEETTIFPPIEEAPSWQLSGAKKFGIELSSSQNLKLDQSLRLEINGKLSPEIEVRAKLSDQQSPLQPEGTTQEIRELDEIVINILAPSWKIILGDYDFQLDEFEFLPVEKKLEGIKVDKNWSRHNLTGVASLSQGTFARVKIEAQSGIQNYQLLVEGKPVVVLAGTEKIWLDGKLMKRGAENDYIIDYTQGIIEFTFNQPLLGGSEIIATFEYLHTDYLQRFFGSTTQHLLFDEKLSLKLAFFTQEDDKERGQANLTPEEIKAFQEGLLYLTENNEFRPISSSPPKNFLLTGILAEYRLTSLLLLKSEYVFSFQDKNTFSHRQNLSWYEEEENQIKTAPKIEKGGAIKVGVETETEKFSFKGTRFQWSKQFSPFGERNLHENFLRRWRIDYLATQEKQEVKGGEVETAWQPFEKCLLKAEAGQMKEAEELTTRLGFTHKFRDNLEYYFYHLFSPGRKDKLQRIRLSYKFKPFTPSLKIEEREKKDQEKEKKEIMAEGRVQKTTPTKINWHYLTRLVFDQLAKKTRSSLHKFNLSFFPHAGFYFNGTSSLICFEERGQKQINFLHYGSLRSHFLKEILTFETTYQKSHRFINRPLVPYLSPEEMKQLKIEEKGIIYRRGRAKEDNLTSEIIWRGEKTKYFFTRQLTSRLFLHFLVEKMEGEAVRKRERWRWVQNIWPQNKFISPRVELGRENSHNSFFYPQLKQEQFFKQLILNSAPLRKISLVLEGGEENLKKDLLGEDFKEEGFEREKNTHWKTIFYLSLLPTTKISFSWERRERKIFYRQFPARVKEKGSSLSFQKILGRGGHLQVSLGSKTTTFEQLENLPRRLTYLQRWGEGLNLTFKYYYQIMKSLDLNFSYRYEELKDREPETTLKLNILSYF